MAATLPLPALTLKIGTLAPAGSPWVESLRRLGAELAQYSAGGVTIKIYAGGTAGEERDIIRKMRIGQLQGGALTQLGLGLLEPGMLALSVPFLIREDPELDFVIERTRGEYEDSLQEKGFRLLTLTKAGWVHFFGSRPVRTPDELRRLRLGVPDGDSDFVDTWRRMGFNAFSLPLGDLLVGLQSGMVDAFYAPPLVAASFQWYELARHMSELRIAPVIGGVVLSAQAFRQVPSELQPRLRELFARLEDELNVQMVNLDREALEAMRRHGLAIDPVPAEAVRQWEELGTRGAEVVIGRSFSRESYRQVLKAVREYHGGQ